MAAAKLPVAKTLEEFNLAESSIPPASHDYLVTLDWIGRADNLCLVGPASTSKSHYLVALGRHAVEAGHKVRYFTAINIVERLYHAVADNTVAHAHRDRVPQRGDHHRRDRLAPLDHTGCQLMFRLVAAGSRTLRGDHLTLTVRAVGPVPPDQPAAIYPRPALPPRPHHHHQRRQLPPHPPDQEVMPHARTLLATSEDRRWPPARTPTWPLTGRRGCGPTPPDRVTRSARFQRSGLRRVPFQAHLQVSLGETCVGSVRVPLPSCPQGVAGSVERGQERSLVPSESASQRQGLVWAAIRICPQTATRRCPPADTFRGERSPCGVAAAALIGA